MTLEERGGDLIITHLPIEQMALLSLGVALTEEERTVLLALLEGRRVYLADGALEYKQYARTAERGIYIRFTAMERELLGRINALGIGPQGFGGRTTALGVAIETAPTHVAGLPVAVNVSCHVTRRASCEL